MHADHQRFDMLALRRRIFEMEVATRVRGPLKINGRPDFLDQRIHVFVRGWTPDNFETVVEIQPVNDERIDPHRAAAANNHPRRPGPFPYLHTDAEKLLDHEFQTEGCPPVAVEGGGFSDEESFFLLAPQGVGFQCYPGRQPVKKIAGGSFLPVRRQFRIDIPVDGLKCALNP